MKKTISIIIILLLICSNAFAAETWKYRVKEVTTPNLTSVRVNYTLTLDGKDYVADEAVFVPQEMEGLTAAQKLASISTKIKARCAEYIKNKKSADGLKAAIEGNEYDAL